MPGIITFIVGVVMAFGGFGEVCGASEIYHTSTVPGTICFVGGVLMMALSRVIGLLGDIRDALNHPKAKENTIIQEAGDKGVAATPPKKRWVIQ
jgi:hypothetical protein